MGKKTRAKGRNTRRANPRISTTSPRFSMANKINPAEEEEKIAPCEHFNLENEGMKSILLRIQSSSGADDKCEDCRVEPGPKKVAKPKGKNLEKRRGTSKSQTSAELSTVWVCLECNHLACGGNITSTPYGHVRRHSKQNKHSVAARLDNPTVGWCFICDSSIPIDIPAIIKEENKQEIVVEEKRTRENGNISLTHQPSGGYSVRGLTNLGNTCFFNSVTQNLLAMGKLRSYFLNLDQANGPLTISLRKLFIETSGGYENNQNQKNRITPSNLFGCVCSKAPQFKGYQQQDSHELLRYLLDGLSTEHSSAMKSAKKYKRLDELGSDSEETVSSLNPTPSFVEEFFSGQLSSTVCCTACGHSSTVFEPFLDLSLPIPRKKPSPRVPSFSLPKKGKGKFSPRGRGRRLRERRSPIASPKSEITEISNSVSESNPSSCTKPESESETGPVFGPSQEDDPSWMDFIGPAPEASISSIHGPRKEDEEENEEESAESGIEFQSDACSGDLKKPESSVILLPYVPLGYTDNPKEEALSPEPESEGLGDLFHEEEENSAPAVKEEALTYEDFGVSWLGGNSSESNQEEIDSSDSPVSVDRCLAYFTTPELLSDEQAWDCENCSKIFREKLNVSESVGPDSSGSVDDGDDLGSNSQEDEEEDRRKKIKRDATKRILIDKSPCILTVHLKRFSQDSRGRLSKLNGHIIFQEMLDLQPYMTSRYIFHAY